MREAVVGHEKQNAGGGGDAGEGSGKHADQGADVDEQAEDGKAAKSREDTHGGRAGREILAGALEAEDLRVGAEDENGSREERALDYGAGNCFKRVLRLRA